MPEIVRHRIVLLLVTSLVAALPAFAGLQPHGLAALRYPDNKLILGPVIAPREHGHEYAVEHHEHPDLGDRFLIDGTLHGLAALARGAAGQLSRIQGGGVQRYVLLAALGVLFGVVWVRRHV